MRRSHKKPIKKNLFDDEDEIENLEQTLTFSATSEQTGSKKMIGKTDQRYDAHKIEQNQLYIGRVQKEEDLKAENKVAEKLSEGKKRSVNFKKKKKNLFQSDEEDKPEEEEEQIKEEEKDEEERPAEKYKKQAIKIEKREERQQEVVVFTANRKNQEKKSSSGSQNQDSDGNQVLQQEEDTAERMKQMINSSEKNQEKKLKQISFSRLLQKAGHDKQKIKQLLYEPIPEGYRATCIFKRSSNAMSESYSLITEDDETSILFCENQRGSIGANYYLSLTKEMDKNSVSYLGKLRGNSTGSVYQLFDGGKQPEKNIDRKEWRTTLARIQYETNLLGMNGPRKLRVMIPSIKDIEDFDSFKLGENEQLSNFQPPIIIKYRNKQPRWNERLKSYALNFGGRVKQASIKNFILVNNEFSIQDEFNAPNTLIFGKIDENSFSLEAVYPLSLFQAFGIVMSEFDFKLNCQ